MKLHHTQTAFFAKLGLTPIVHEDKTWSVLVGSKIVRAKTPKELIALLATNKAPKAPAKSKKARKAAPKKKVARADDEEAEDGEEDEDPHAGRSGMVKAQYKTLYRLTDGHCGDDLAGLLREQTKETDEEGNEFTSVKAIQGVARQNGLTAKGKNPGHMLMNLSNVLRARVRRGEKVSVGRATINEPKKVHPAKCWDWSAVATPAE